MRDVAARVLIWLLACVAASPSTTAQQDGEPPRIGLVLSGGGARGAAHVGVLQVLEELQVPIWCVTGTSMGSIVGGLYAYGLSPGELAAVMRREGDRSPWRELLQDGPPRTSRTFRRKQEDYSLLVDFGLGLHGGRFRLPKGLLQGQNLELELLALTAEAHDLASFDDLRLPFRAVAVELRTGRPVVLEHGNLAHAMRASMSLPGVFAPAVVDGVELLDGGLADNVPIALARALGATVVIVVDIGTPVSADHVDSVLDVSGQMVQILTQQNVDRSLAGLRDGDVFLRPDLGDITSADFDRAAESIRIGEATARAAAEALRELSADDTRWHAYLEQQRRRSERVVVEGVDIDNRTQLSDALFRARIRTRPGDLLDLAQLRQDLEWIHGLGNFERVTFELRDGSAGRKRVLVHVVDKSWGPTFLRFGLSLTGDLRGSSAFTVASQINMRELNGLGAEWRTDFRVGDQTGALTEFYQPLVPSGVLFAAANAGGDVRQGAGSIGVVDLRFYQAGLDVGANLGAWGELRLGYKRYHGDVDFESVLPFPGFHFDDGLLQAQFVVDTLDDAAFPTTGMRMQGTWIRAIESLGADDGYEQLAGSASGFVSAGRVTVSLGGAVQSTMHGTLPLYRASAVGGFTKLSGSDNSSISGQHSALVVGAVRMHLAGSQADQFGFPLYVGATVESGNAWATRDERFGKMLLAGSVFTALGTPLGPVYFAYGYTDGGDDSFYLFVGQLF
ncbi:MAG: patatin-like phospholipase family protein [Planctomycetes bacterium]|nr:patatin-like phospholipase family protein [Planctomycetota bacterium]